MKLVITLLECNKTAKVCIYETKVGMNLHKQRIEN